jgi:hypothetical protein
MARLPGGQWNIVNHYTGGALADLATIDQRAPPPFILTQKKRRNNHGFLLREFELDDRAKHIGTLLGDAKEADLIERERDKERERERERERVMGELLYYII